MIMFTYNVFLFTGLFVEKFGSVNATINMDYRDLHRSPSHKGSIRRTIMFT